VFNALNGAQCSDPNVLACTAKALAALAYWNYRATALDTISLRTEYYDDMEGSGPVRKLDMLASHSVCSIGCYRKSSFAQKSPTINARTNDFNGNFNQQPVAIAPNTD
jgi:hypothetical protein